MSKGTFALTVTHACGTDVEVTVVWWDYPARTPRGEYAPIDPPDAGEEPHHPERCPGCGATLEADDQFQGLIEIGIANQRQADQEAEFRAEAAAYDTLEERARDV